MGNHGVSSAVVSLRACVKHLSELSYREAKKFGYFFLFPIPH